ncbi:hypothetical protein GJU40_19195 [Bacillus lacus]|uniref:Right handed beta helix domain-containing protein n=1 Tax=Metabacillus lacus TaxID=1983721 RepID=A0A7X2J2N2_9BACI|nr:right-handed parallel beta-helix repeat-containing protein [Metabacillus lacus]MRX74250.1 hypothetical protein [Metabacillus lacus]
MPKIVIAEAGGSKWIQEAVNAVDEYGTVLLSPGDYFENIELNKPVFLKGAKAGSAAREREHGKETVIHGCIFIHSNGGVVDGLTVIDSAEKAGIIMSEAFSGCRILNNCIRDNENGIFLRTSGNEQTLIDGNIIEDNKLNGIFTFEGISNVIIKNNIFTGHDYVQGAAIHFGTAGRDANLLISGNHFVDEAPVVLANTQHVIIESNRFLGSRVSAVFLGGGTADTLLRDNTIQNNFYGIQLTTSIVVKENKRLVLTNNHIENNIYAVLLNFESYKGAVMARHNYWGAKKLSALESRNSIINLDFSAAVLTEPLLEKNMETEE